MKAEYGNITNFLLQKRLYWKPLPSYDPSQPPSFSYKDPTPFVERSDYRILINNWPYGLAPGIKHICVWLKMRLPVVEETGDLTDHGEAMVNEFVERIFTQGLGLEGKDKVTWFKNWVGLQSVRGLEHIHVLVRDVDEVALDKILERPTK